MNENSQYIYDVDAVDVDGDVLSYSISTTANWLSISNTGLISGHAPNISVDTNFDITVIVSDGKGGTDTQNYVLTVIDNVDNTAPIITINTNPNQDDEDILINVSVNENATVWFVFNGVNYTMNTNDNMNFNYWLTNLDDKNYEIIIYARDNAGNIASEDFAFKIDTSKDNDNEEDKNKIDFLGYYPQEKKQRTSISVEEEKPEIKESKRSFLLKINIYLFWLCLLLLILILIILLLKIKE